MRDIAFSLVFMTLWVQCFLRPFMGPLLWAWVSMMYPHRLTFGFAHNLPVAAVAGVTTLGVFFFSRDKHPFPRYAPAILMVFFFAWGCITSLASFNDPAMVFGLWLKVAKIQIMLFVTMMMLAGRQHILWLVGVIALSVGFYGFKGGLFTLLTGGGSHVMGPPGSFIENNNEIGLAIVMVVPLLYFLYSVNKNKWLRLGLLAVTALSVVAVLGTYSRGAVLAAATMALFLGLKSNRKALTLAFVTALLVGMMTFLPDKWSERMQSISTHEDYSSQSRLNCWQMIWNLALDNPVTGGGYRITENEATWEKYAVTEYSRALAPHSIYFQVLAEHGFVGLFLFLALGISTWRLASRTATQARDGPDREWVPQLMRMIQVSLIAFAVAGIFASLANYDLPYYLSAIVAMVARDTKVRSAFMAEAKTFPFAGASR